jgi:hypothetical protein
MNIELSKEDLLLLDMLLSKELEETKTEIHHSSSVEYKDYLKNRELRLKNLLARVKNALGVNAKIEEEVRI